MSCCRGRPSFRHRSTHSTKWTRPCSWNRDNAASMRAGVSYAATRPDVVLDQGLDVDSPSQCRRVGSSQQILDEHIDELEPDVVQGRLDVGDRRAAISGRCEVPLEPSRWVEQMAQVPGGDDVVGPARRRLISSPRAELRIEHLQRDVQHDELTRHVEVARREVHRGGDVRASSRGVGAAPGVPVAGAYERLGQAVDRAEIHLARTLDARVSRFESAGGVCPRRSGAPCRRASRPRVAPLEPGDDEARHAHAPVRDDGQATPGRRSPHTRPPGAAAGGPSEGERHIPLDRRRQRRLITGGGRTRSLRDPAGR